MRRLPLGPIEAFVVVARGGSLAAAAPTLGLTVPALSRRIRLLEADLGMSLFHRHSRGLALTEAGARYLAALGPAWDGVARATAAARRAGGSAALAVSVMPTFAANWLVPRLPGLRARHPDLEVAIETDAELVDLAVRPDLDCAIRLGHGPWPGLDCRTLLPVDAVPVVRPGFFGAEPPRSAGDLLRHPLIGTHHQPDFWREWFAAEGIDGADVESMGGGRWRAFDNLQLVHEAAAAGLGIALGLDPVVRPYLESGRLVPIFPAPVRLPRAFHLVRRAAPGGENRRLALFGAWLRAEAAAFLHAASGLQRA